MSYMDKQYIAPTGIDYTKWVNTEEDAKIFDKMCWHEERTKGVLAVDCIEDIVAALNLGRDLEGIAARVNYIGKQDVKNN